MNHSVSRSCPLRESHILTSAHTNPGSGLFFRGLLKGTAALRGGVRFEFGSFKRTSFKALEGAGVIGVMALRAIVTSKENHKADINSDCFPLWVCLKVGTRLDLLGKQGPNFAETQLLRCGTSCAPPPFPLSFPAPNGSLRSFLSCVWEAQKCQLPMESA